jgi:hypothetical protein
MPGLLLAHIPAKACPGLDPGWTPVRRSEYAPNENPERIPIPKERNALWPPVMV